VSESKMTRNRVVRYALVVAATAGVSYPLVSQRLRAQDEPAPAAAEQADAPRDGAPGDDEARPAAAAQDEAPAGDAAAPAEPASPDAPAGADAAPAAGDADAAKVIASAGDLEVTVADFENFLAGIPPQQAAQMRGEPEAKRQLVDHLLKMKALAREAEKQGLHEQTKLRRQLESVRTQILAQAMVTSLTGEDEAADKAYFEEHKNDFGKVQARHILVATRNTDPNSKKKPLSDEQAKQKAGEIRERLVNGEDFAALAKAESDDPGSKETGGTYTFGRGDMVPAFEQSAFSLKENEISQPIKTQFGYHVIQLQKRLPGTFEEARSSIGRQRLEAKIKELMGADPKFDDSFFAAGGGGAGANGGGGGGAKDAGKQAPAEKPANGKGAK
jgi:peptidyl-prolyl cis-trans isomerase C